MNTKKILVSTCFAALAYLSGCGIQVGGVMFKQGEMLCRQDELAPV